MNQIYENWGQDDDEELEYYAIRPNKTQIKREMAELFSLGEELTTLSQSQLSVLELPDQLLTAIQDVAGMPPKGARKRQLKYIAGLLHKLDVGPIKEALAHLRNQSVHAVREHHHIERWRDRLLGEGNDALSELLSEMPHADRPYIRQLVRNAHKESAADKAPKAARELYRYLKELFSASFE